MRHQGSVGVLTVGSSPEETTDLSWSQFWTSSQKEAVVGGGGNQAKKAGRDEAYTVLNSIPPTQIHDHQEPQNMI